MSEVESAEIWVVVDCEVTSRIRKHKIALLGNSLGRIVRDGRIVKKIGGRWVYGLATCGDAMMYMQNDDHIREAFRNSGISIE